MKNPLFVSEPYWEVCYACGQRTHVVALHLPCDLATNALSSSRLCRDCCRELAVKLLPPASESVSSVQPQKQGFELHECRIHTRNSVIYRTVMLQNADDGVGKVRFTDGLVPVYLVPDGSRRNWTTIAKDALYLANAGRKVREERLRREV